MELKYRRAPIARAGLVGAMLLLGAACVSSAGAQPRGGGDRCFSDDFGGRRNDFESLGGFDAIALNCRRLAATTTQIREVAFANYWAGRAYLANGNLREAEDALRVVAYYAPAGGGGGSARRDVGLELTRVDAKVVLAQVYAKQNRRSEAVDLVNTALGEYGAIERSLQTPQTAAFRRKARDGRANASVSLAAIHNSAPADERRALNALHIFIETGSDDLPNVAAMRQSIVETATKLGEEKLTVLRKERSVDTQESATFFFSLAREAAVAARAPLAQPNINLGQVLMIANGLKGPEEASGCESSVSDSTPVREAKKLFAEAGDTELALQWKGCAEMALNELDAARNSFARAAQGSSPESQLALARALFRLARTSDGTSMDWVAARDRFNAAIASLKGRRPADNARLAKLHLELAKMHLHYIAQPSYPAGRKAPLGQEALTNLREATRLSDRDAESFLRLGMISVAEPVFEEPVFQENAAVARASLNRVLELTVSPEKRGANAEAHYWLSRLEMRRGRGAGNAAAAIDQADRAVQRGDGLGAPLYLGVDGAGPDYVAQSCDVRLFFRVRVNEASRYCLSESSDPRALLRQGMYYLSLGALPGRSASERSKAWDNALSAFDRGASAVTDTDSNADARQLEANLLVGKGLAMRCSGLIRGGDDIINRIGPALQGKAREHFSGYDLLRC